MESSLGYIGKGNKDLNWELGINNGNWSMSFLNFFSVSCRWREILNILDIGIDIKGVNNDSVRN